MNERRTRPAANVGESRVVTLTIPAKPEYVTLSRLALTGLSRVRPLSEETLADLKLALTEATSNSVRHAYSNGEGQVRISFELCEDRLIVEVSDDGSGFESRPHESSSESTGNGAGHDDLSEGGLGIAIIRSIADELELGSGPNGGSRLRFTKLF
ncbi:MAG: ATP-binding protein [Gaiellaceae bacterium]